MTIEKKRKAQLRQTKKTPNQKKENNNLNLILILKPPLFTFEITVLLLKTELMPRGQAEPPVQ